MTPLVIGIAGRAGSGKSTVASMLVAGYGFRVVKFAAPIKSMLQQLGLTQEELEGERKGLPCKLLGGRSPRYAMQTLGTEWGRQIIHEDIWTTRWKALVKQQLLDGISIVCDDCRFENEVRAVEDLGGEVWSVVRPGNRPVGGHISESGAATRLATVRITNGGALSDLQLTIADLMSRS